MICEISVKKCNDCPFVEGLHIVSTKAKSSTYLGCHHPKTIEKEKSGKPVEGANIPDFCPLITFETLVTVNMMEG